MQGLPLPHVERIAVGLHALEEIEIVHPVEGVEGGVTATVVGQLGRDQVLLAALLENDSTEVSVRNPLIGLPLVTREGRRARSAHIEDHGALGLAGHHPEAASVADVEVHEIVVGVAAGAELEFREVDVVGVCGVAGDVEELELVPPVEDQEGASAPGEGIDLERAVATGGGDAAIRCVEENIRPHRAVALGRRGGRPEGRGKREHAKDGAAREKTRNPGANHAHLHSERYPRNASDVNRRRRPRVNFFNSLSFLRRGVTAVTRRAAIIAALRHYNEPARLRQSPFSMPLSGPISARRAALKKEAARRPPPMVDR